MHKEEASQLFACLGDPNRVKIVKMLYNNDSLTLKALEQRIGVDSFELKSHLKTLVDANLILNQQEVYRCNKELVDTLMSFISTRCGCCS